MLTASRKLMPATTAATPRADSRRNWAKCKYFGAVDHAKQAMVVKIVLSSRGQIA